MRVWRYIRFLSKVTPRPPPQLIQTTSYEAHRRPQKKKNTCKNCVFSRHPFSFFKRKTLINHARFIDTGHRKGSKIVVPSLLDAVFRWPVSTCRTYVVSQPLPEYVFSFFLQNTRSSLSGAYHNTLPHRRSPASDTTFLTVRSDTHAISVHLSRYTSFTPRIPFPFTFRTCHRRNNACILTLARSWRNI